MPKSIQFKHLNMRSGAFKEVKADGKEHGNFKVTDKGEYFYVVYEGSSGGGKYGGKAYKFGKYAVILQSDSNNLYFEILEKKGGILSSGGTFLKWLKGAESKAAADATADGVAALEAKLQAEKEAKAASKAEGFKPKRIGVLKAYKKDNYYKRIYNV